MSGGRNGRNGTELILSPNASAGLAGDFGGPDRTTPYRGVLPSPVPHRASEQPSPSRLSPGFSHRAEQGGRDAPLTGAGPVPRSDPSDEQAELMADYGERAAIREFDGGLSRPVAERLAWADLQRGKGIA